jgi:hypothetical protein
LVNGDAPETLLGVLTFSTSATAGSDVGSYPVMPSGLSTSNYAISYVSGALMVTPASLAVTADDATRVYGASNPAFTATYSGLVNGDTARSLGGALSFTTLASASSPAGSYAIVPSGLSAKNYMIQFVKGTLAITPAASPVVGGPGGAQPEAPPAAAPSSGTSSDDSKTPAATATGNVDAISVANAGPSSVTITIALYNGVAAALPLVRRRR